MTSIKEALEGLIEAVTREANEPLGRGISGYTAARLTDAKAAIATLQPAGESREAIALQIWNDRLKRRGETPVTMENVNLAKARGFDILAMDRPTADAILASGLVQNEAGIPDGYVLAPIEPTETMLAACEESKPENAKTERRRILATRLRDEGRSIRRADYRAMISAIRSARDGGES